MPHKTLQFTLAQINTSVGDIAGNVEKICHVWEHADRASDLIIFPELTLTGYPPLDLLHNPQFVARTERAVQHLVEFSNTKSSAILIGGVRRDGLSIFNAGILIDRGRVVSIVGKRHLPNYGVFDERRYFAAAPLSPVVSFREAKLGILICEDMWYPANAKNLKDNGAQILVCINSSPFEKDKHENRLGNAMARVVETNLPLIYVNQVGGQDDLVFDGGSFFLNADKESLAQGPFNKEWVSTVSFDTCPPRQFPEVAVEERTYGAVVLGLGDYMKKTGQKKILLGLSGGVDSALAAAIAADAVGKANVHALLMPSEFTSQSSIDDAVECAKRIGISHETISITPMVESFMKLQPDTAGLAHENLQSRLRGLLLMTRSNTTGAMVISTGNKSEMAMGYATMYGDMCGGYNPLKDLYKTDVYKLCDWLNRTRAAPPIPQSIIDKAPTAELRPNQKDEDSLPPYAILDKILEQLIEEDKAPADIIKNGADAETVYAVAHALKMSEYKRRQSPPGPKISSRDLTKDRRYPIANVFINAK